MELLQPGYLLAQWIKDSDTDDLPPDSVITDIPVEYGDIPDNMKLAITARTYNYLI